MKKEQKSLETFPNLRNCARYLLQHHLHDLVEENIRLSHQYNLSYLITSYNKEEEYIFFKRNLENFLNDISDEGSRQAPVKYIKDFTLNKLEWSFNKDIPLSDLISELSVFKQVIQNFLPTYTTDITEAFVIVRELEALHLQIEKQTVKSFLSFKEEALNNEKNLSKAIINNSINGVIVYDRALNVIIWNNAIQLTPLKKELIIKAKIWETFPWLQTKNLITRYGLVSPSFETKIRSIAEGKIASFRNCVHLYI
jgi:hypothetical protein